MNVNSRSFVSEREFYLWMQLPEICSGVFLGFRKNTVGKKNFPPRICLRAGIESRSCRENCKELCEEKGVIV